MFLKWEGYNRCIIVCKDKKLWYTKYMNLKIYWIKFKTSVEVFLSRFVYNFNKFVSGIKVKRNLKYVNGGNKYNKLDIIYPDNKHKKTLGEENKLPVIVYFHGGGWAAYSKSCYSTVCKRLADMGYVVFNCNYSLTPKYSLSHIISDCVSAIRFAIQNAEKFGGDATKVCLAGDSAGAHIASFISGVVTSDKGQFFFGQDVSNKLKDVIKANLLFYGVYDLNSVVYTEFQDIESYIRAIVDLDSEDSPRFLKKFSSISYVTPNFPPSFLSSGEVDKLHESQSKVMADILEQNNVKTEKIFFSSDEYRAMHAYIVIDGLKTTDITFDRVEKFLKETMWENKQ